jgi:hypothetical protein
MTSRYRLLTPPGVLSAIAVITIVDTAYFQLAFTRPESTASRERTMLNYLAM